MPKSSADKLFRQACCLRDRLFREDKARWERCSKLFEIAALEFDNAGDEYGPYYSKYFASGCRRQAKACLGRAELPLGLRQRIPRKGRERG